MQQLRFRCILSPAAKRRAVHRQQGRTGGARPPPNLFEGAPSWVASPVLNPRRDAGLLSFCSWWDDGRWYRGQSPAAEHCVPAMPGIWTTDLVTDTVAGMIGKLRGRELHSAARELVGPLLSATLIGARFTNRERALCAEVVRRQAGQPADTAS